MLTNDLLGPFHLYDSEFPPGIIYSPILFSVDSDDATICTTSLLSSSSPSGGGIPYTKEAVGTPPPSPSVSSGLSGAG